MESKAYGHKSTSSAVGSGSVDGSAVVVGHCGVSVAYVDTTGVLDCSLLGSSEVEKQNKNMLALSKVA